jgi:hypothetical protein
MVGSGAANAEPEFKKYSDNLIDCQRYYSVLRQAEAFGYAAGANTLGGSFTLPAAMRATPTVTSANFTYGNASAASAAANSTNVVSLIASIPAGGGFAFAKADIFSDADF